VRRWWRRGLYQGRRLRGAPEVTATDLAAALRALGIRSGDDLLVHSSLRGLGVVGGGVDAVVRALQEVVAEGGTLLAPAYPLQSTMQEHLERGGIALDVRLTPSRMGQISEAIRRLPGSRRSLHPTHSVSAVGPRAEWYCSGHERSRSPCGPGSPFVKLIERAGWVVALGSPIGKVTSYHVLEDRAERFPVPVYLDRVFHARVIDAEGRDRDVEVRCHDPAVSARRIDNTRDIEAAFERLLAERGVLRTTHVGTGMISAMRADGLEAALEVLLEEGITIYGVGPSRPGR
jgi:aminoglycoside 3-N-acetyltransferase